MRKKLSAAIFAAVVATTMVQTPVSAQESPSQDAFYVYTGAKPLSAITPGTILKSRKVWMHLVGLPLPVTAEELLYRTTNTTGHPAVTVTTVLKPLVSVFSRPRLVSYQIAYDSLSSTCQPSYALAGGVDFHDFLDPLESSLITSYLLGGYTVVTSDYEGQDLAFGAGIGSGRATLDGIRAALHSRAVRLPASTRVGLVGYSGGAIATEWAADSHLPTHPRSTGPWSAPPRAASPSAPNTTSTTSTAPCCGAARFLPRFSGSAAAITST